jgi:formate dehydrogenase maturation protein FdhE
MTPRSSWLHRDTTLADAFERRAARADQLAAGATTAAPLTFAAGLYRAQAKVAEALARSAPTGSLADDLPALLGALDGIVRYARDRGPSGLSADADGFRGESRDGKTERLVTWWLGARAGRIDYLARALLRPYGESIAAAGITPEAPSAKLQVVGSCPRCGGPPWIGWRRSGSGDEAPQRFVGCGICGTETVLSRIACAACGQTEPTKLAVFQTERHAGVRIEACDVCLRYVKSIDLTLDGRAVPEIDDLASLSLDLWAGEQGYERLEPSLAGV